MGINIEVYRKSVTETHVYIYAAGHVISLRHIKIHSWTKEETIFFLTSSQRQQI